MANAAELAAELSIIASRMRELGVVRLRTLDVEIELGALAPIAPKGKQPTDTDYLFAATEGIAEEGDEAT